MLQWAQHHRAEYDHAQHYHAKYYYAKMENNCMLGDVHVASRNACFALLL